jgi:hypothetical protein
MPADWATQETARRWHQTLFEIYTDRQWLIWWILLPLLPKRFYCLMD